MPMSMHNSNPQKELECSRYTPLDYSSAGVFSFQLSHYLSTFLLIIIGLITFSSTSCEEKISTPDWSSITTEQPNESPPDAQLPPTNLPSPNLPTRQQVSSSKTPIRFVCYNLRNYLTMHRGTEKKFKPEREVTAIIDNIIRASPDILGVCEIGTQADLEHLQRRLTTAGCDLPHSYLSVGADPYRRQALLSRFPIHPNNVPKYTYNMKGKRHEVRRGILDATLQTPKGEIRLLGAHLKSKRPLAGYDQAEIRLEEAQILRKHASSILTVPSRKLLVFGDMNDTKGSSTIRLMTGSKDRKLTSIETFDKYGTKWTQYWAREDIYSRFDYVFASKSILPMIDKKASYILDTPPGDVASDHRALVIIIR